MSPKRYRPRGANWPQDRPQIRKIDRNVRSDLSCRSKKSPRVPKAALRGAQEGPRGRMSPKRYRPRGANWPQDRPQIRKIDRNVRSDLSCRSKKPPRVPKAARRGAQEGPRGRMSPQRYRPRGANWPQDRPQIRKIDRNIRSDISCRSKTPPRVPKAALRGAQADPGAHQDIDQVVQIGGETVESVRKTTKNNRNSGSRFLIRYFL